MKKNELLDQFYKKRKSFINRVLIATIILLILISVSFQFHEKESFIARISIQGIIQDRKDLLDQLEGLSQNENVKGLLTIINSPGGTYVASKEVHDSIKNISNKIPTVAYMREMATSGGYLASLGSDKIFGNEGTITGSVGVILQTADISELLGKLGISPIIIKSGELKAVPNPVEKIDDQKKKYLEEIIKTMQKEFLQIVRVKRNISDNTLELVSDGRIFTGKQAKNLSLIDEVGNENDALNWLKEEAGVEDNIRIKDLSLENDISRIFNLSFLKKKINYLNQNFYNGFFAIWTPGI